MAVPIDRELVRQVLDGLTFPAHHWQVLAQAELYGIDMVTHERIRRLGEHAGCS